MQREGKVYQQILGKNVKVEKKGMVNGFEMMKEEPTVKQPK